MKKIGVPTQQKTRAHVSLFTRPATIELLSLLYSRAHRQRHRRITDDGLQDYELRSTNSKNSAA